MKRPSFQFYPGDWLRDTALRSVSVAARGAWSDMLCLMHEGTPYGHLKVGSKVILPDNLARMIGLTLEETSRLVGELEEAGVFSRTTEGCIYSRRMVRDEEIREKRAKGGILGGNPALMDKLKVNLEGYPSLARAAEGDEDAGAAAKEVGNGKSTATPEEEEIYSAYPKKKGRGQAIKAIRGALKKIPAGELLSAVKKYAESAIGKDFHFEPNPATWFNGERWLDEPLPLFVPPLNGNHRPTVSEIRNSQISGAAQAEALRLATPHVNYEPPT